MKKLLYVSNIEVPYRTEYFNQLSKKLNLTVLYERKKSSNRNANWTESIKSKYSIKYLKGIKVNKEYTFDFRIIKYAFSKEYDDIIFGCYNSPSQILAILLMRLFRKKYILNLDGEYFFNGNGIKDRIKRFLIKGAKKYFIAGDNTKINLAKYVEKEKIYSYHFSSLTNDEIKINNKNTNENKNNMILVVGQFFEYKGLDVALKCAKLDQSIKYKFIGSGSRSNLLEEKVKEMNLDNVEIIPFLQKQELYNEYRNCKCLLLPSRKECWGLVINEAASFGCPIISTFGSGAAVELLEKKWLVNSEDYKDMYEKILLLNENKYNKKLLIKKSKKYTIENNVDETIEMLDA